MASTNKMKKKIIVHVGLSKTGSSAIQNELAELTLTNKIDPKVNYSHFNFTRSSVASSGNGEWFKNNLLIPDTITIKNNLDILFSENKSTLIFSGEGLNSLSPQKWIKFNKILIEREVDLTVFFVVRDIREWLLSSYSQSLKRNGETRSFSSSIKSRNLDGLKKPFEYSKYFKVKVLKYSNDRYFAEKCSEIFEVRLKLNRKVNPRLSKLGMSFARNLNKFFPIFIVARLIDHMQFIFCSQQEFKNNEEIDKVVEQVKKQYSKDINIIKKQFGIHLN